MTKESVHLVHYKMVDGEVFLNAEQLQRAITAQSQGVTLTLRAAFADNEARRAQMVFDAVVAKIGRYRTLALSQEAKKTTVDKFVNAVIDKLLSKD